MYNIKENLNYENVVSKINNIFNNLEKTIRLDIFNKTKINTRINKISFIEAMIYKFKYASINETKQNITNEYNFNNNTSIVRSSFYEKERNISISIYKNIFFKLSSLYKQLVNNITTIIAVDGTYNNTKVFNKKGILETNLNLGFYDVENNIPFDLTFEGFEKKNKELECLKHYILNNNFDKNVIFVLDRAYCSYEFVDFLNKNNLKFVIRFRNNCKNFNKIKSIKNVRIIKYIDYYNQVVINKNLTNLHDGIQYNNVTLKNKYEYTLLTNLNIKIHNDVCIKNIYKQRWSVEIFFKILKKNFNFEHLNEHNKQQSNDAYVKHNIITIICLLLEKTHYYNNIENKIKDLEIKNKNNSIKYELRSNKSQIIKGVFRIIDNIIKGQLNTKLFSTTCNCYVSYSKVILGLSNIRIAITPFLKWYVKGYTNKSDIYKILEALINKDPSNLNKNLKMKYKNIEIIKYNYI